MRTLNLLFLSCLFILATTSSLQASSLAYVNEYEPGTVLIKFKAGTSAVTKASVAASIGGKSIHSYKIVPGLEIIKALGEEVPSIIEKISKNPNVEYAEPNYKVKALGTHPNDTYWAELWGMLAIDAPTAWDTTIGNSDNVIAVIDTGVDYTHPDLTANIWTNPGEIAGNGIDDDGNGYVDDVHGYDFLNYDSNPIDDDHYHGTHVAGTIGAIGDNSIGVVGVNWNCKIMALKFLGPDGGYTDDAILALEYAVNNGAKLSNNSWGGGGFSQSLYDAIANAGSSGHIFIAAAGNGGDDGLGDDNDLIPHYPSSYELDNIISVASTDSSNNLSGFSNYGLISVDLAAPGSNILSSVPLRYVAQYDGYHPLSGTSMATPHVTGAIALLLAKNSLLTTGELKSAIFDSVTQLEALNGKVSTGGLLNVSEAINSVDNPINNPPTASYTYTISDLTVVFADASTDTDGSIASWLWDFTSDGIIDSAEQNPQHTFASAGTYTVSLTVTDNDGESSTVEQTVTVTEPTPVTTISVSDLDGVVDSDDGKFWYAEVTVSVNGGSEAVTVGGIWSDGSVGSCTTIAEVCSLLSRKSRKDSMTFTVTNLSNGVDEYDPNANSDNDGDSDGTVIVISRDGSIPGANTNPIAENDTVTTTVGNAVTINVLNNDRDDDGDNLTVTSVAGAENGTVTYSSETVTYTPSSTFIGQDSFEYTISDGRGCIATATVNVTVNETQPATLIFVSDLSGDVLYKNVNTVTVTITVNDSIDNATVYGTWSDGASGEASCITSSGQCSVNLRTKILPVTFTVDNITGTDLTYDVSSNIESFIEVQ